MLLLALCAIGTACAPIALTRSVVKIGLVAPFEGPGRALGYNAIFAARLALREANAAGGVGGRALELVALDDGGFLPLALRQVRALAADPDVLAAVHLVSSPVAVELTDAYRRAGLPVRFMESGTGNEIPDAEFNRRYLAVSQGMLPTSLSVRTYRSVQETIGLIADRAQSGARRRTSP